MNHRVACFLLLVASVILTGCQQKMARQPSYRPLEPSTFFRDGRSARPLPAGTVATNQPLEDSRLLTGRLVSDDQAARNAGLVGVAAPGGMTPLRAAAEVVQPNREYVDTFPIRIDRPALERGRQRFNIFCAVCHDETGNGNGKIVERGFTRPPSYTTDFARGFERRGYKILLRDVPIGYFFEVITQGYGAMPDYSSQVVPEDRWKIAAYIKALQLSQYTDLNDPRLKPDRRAIEQQLAKETP
jgi:mono/diheme cytochrome c family protein